MDHNARQTGVPCGDGRPFHSPQIRPHQQSFRKDDGADLQEGEGHPQDRGQIGYRCTLNVHSSNVNL